MDEGADHESIFEEIRKIDLINERRPPESEPEAEAVKEQKVESLKDGPSI